MHRATTKQARIQEALEASQTWHTSREVAQITGINPASTYATLNNLYKMGLLRKAKQLKASGKALLVWTAISNPANPPEPEPQNAPPPDTEPLIIAALSHGWSTVATLQKKTGLKPSHITCKLLKLRALGKVMSRQFEGRRKPQQWILFETAKKPHDNSKTPTAKSHRETKAEKLLEFLHHEPQSLSKLAREANESQSLCFDLLAHLESRELAQCTKDGWLLKQRTTKGSE